MQQLPEDKILPINLLISCFNKTSSTYKFYWLLSIIDALESRLSIESTTIPKKELFARMIANAWYTVNYFRVSFGKQDKLHSAVINIKELENLPIDANKQLILSRLINSNNPQTINELLQFNKQVPHWFLSPWFPGENKAAIYQKSQSTNFKCLYSLNEKFISVDLFWANYLLINATLIRNFCFWNLVVFLQNKNPNVPDIPNKIIKPAIRNNLTNQRKFWNTVFDETESLNCIYTNQSLSKENYAIEHFIPYSFLSHDLMWNLIPADRAFNSIKSDKLPNLEIYFNGFFIIQKIAIDIIREKEPRNKYLEDYLTIFTPDQYKNIENIKLKFRNTLEPLITIASNNGFEFL